MLLARCQEDRCPAVGTCCPQGDFSACDFDLTSLGLAHRKPWVSGSLASRVGPQEALGVWKLGLTRRSTGRPGRPGDEPGAG